MRLTGGEPLLRRDLPELVRMLAAKPAIRDLALTTNGVAARRAGATRCSAAGLHRLTVSLDTLQPERFRALTRFDELPQVLAGIEPPRRIFAGLKLDAVVMRGTNDDEIVALLEYGEAMRRRGPLHRVHGRRRRDALVARAGRCRGSEMLAALGSALRSRSSRSSKRLGAPADRFRLPDGTVFGIISSTTEPFCRNCDRSRLTADGMWYLCLYATAGTDLRGAAARGRCAGPNAAADHAEWTARSDRGAEERLALRDRAPLVPVRP